MNLIKKMCISAPNSVRMVLLLTFLLAFDSVAISQGDLLIFPKRVVFEGRYKVEQVILSNTGKEPAAYNISFLEYRMNEFGEFELITETDSDQRFATPFLRVFPRRVELAPGESQTVKVQVLNADKMEDGEYRSHLYFRSEKNNSPLGEERSDAEATSIAVKLEAVYGISIATIIRRGKTHVKSSIGDLQYVKDENDNHILNFTIYREGNISSYGDIVINYYSSEGEKIEVGSAKGLAVYTPGNSRRVRMLLQNLKDVDFNSGRLEVLFTENDKKEIQARAETRL